MYKNICIEGLDGTGKTTLAKTLAAKLNIPFVFEPSNTTPVTKQLRTLALNSDYSSEVNGLPREYIMAANRAITNNSTLKLLETSNVISDRSPLSGLVYAKTDPKMNMDFQTWTTLHAANLATLKPSIIVYVTNKTRKIASEKAGNKDIYDSESEAFFDKLSSTFQEGLSYFYNEFNIPHIVFENSFSLTPEENAAHLHLVLGRV